MYRSLGRPPSEVVDPAAPYPGKVSPRRNRTYRRDARERGELPDQRVRKGVEGVQRWPDGEWVVRSIFGGAATKAYRCPGCMQEIRPGAAHVVAWPVDAPDAESAPAVVPAVHGVEERRHWHTGCWQARDRRGPAVERSRSAPRYG
jgi:hypothetical protein